MWNSTKAAANRRKHGVSFEQAVESFFDPFLRLVDASRTDEARHAIIGMDQIGRVLFVVHMEIEGESIRIISARKVTHEERCLYDS